MIPSGGCSKESSTFLKTRIVPDRMGMVRHAEFFMFYGWPGPAMRALSGSMLLWGP
jgi:hypothetical protein